MLGLLMAATALGGAFLTDAQLVTDVEVACNYAGGQVRVLVPTQPRAVRELLSGTCAAVWRAGRGTPAEVLARHAWGDRCAIYLRPTQDRWWSTGLGTCGPIAAGRAEVGLEWPEIPLSVYCRRNSAHPACLLGRLLDDSGGVAWPGDCPADWVRRGQHCYPEGGLEEYSYPLPGSTGSGGGAVDGGDDPTEAEPAELHEGPTLPLDELYEQAAPWTWDRRSFVPAPSGSWGSRSTAVSPSGAPTRSAGVRSSSSSGQPTPVRSGARSSASSTSSSTSDRGPTNPGRGSRKKK